MHFYHDRQITAEKKSSRIPLLKLRYFSLWGLVFVLWLASGCSTISIKKDQGLTAPIKNSSPVMVVQSGQADEVIILGVNQEGSQLITSCVPSKGWVDGPCPSWLWDIKSGFHIKNLHEDRANGDIIAAVSPRWTYLAEIYTQVAALCIRKLETGEIVARLPPKGPFNELLNAVSFSPDERYVLGCTNNGSKIWDVNTLTLVSELKDAISGTFLTEGQMLVTGGNDGKLKVRRINDGLPIREFEGHSGSLEVIKVTPDGKFLVTGGSDGIVAMWDVQQLKLKWKSERGPRKIRSLEISPDGTTIVSGGYDGFLYIHESGTGRLQKILDARLSSRDAVSSMVFNPDGKELFVGTGRGQIEIWETAGWKEHHPLARRARTNCLVGVDAEGRRLAMMGSDGSTQVWDLDTMSVILSTPGNMPGYPLAVLRKDGKVLVASSTWETVEVWDVEQKKSIKKLPINRGFCNSFALDPQGRYLAYSTTRSLGKSRNGVVMLLDLEKGEPIKTFFERPEHFGSYLTGEAINNLVFSPDGSMLAASTALLMNNQLNNHSQDGTGLIRVFDVGTGKIVREWLEGFFPSGLAFSPDGSQLMARMENGITLPTGHILSPDVDKFIEKKEFRVVRVWDLSSGKDLGQGSPEKYESGIASFLSPNLPYSRSSPDLTLRGWKVGESIDGGVGIWDLRTHELLATLVGMGSEWVVFTPDGYFDASKNGREAVAMVKDGIPFGIDQLALVKNRPDIILERLKSPYRELIQHFHHRYLKRLTTARLSETSLDGDWRVPKVVLLGQEMVKSTLRLTFSATDRDRELKRYNVYVDDVPLFGASGKNISGHEVHQVEEIPLTGGRNKIEVTCWNDQGIEAFRALTYVDSPATNHGDLYYVGFGVSKYQNPALTLQFADKDAEDLSGMLSRMKGQGFDKILTKTFLNHQVTTRALQEARDFIGRAKPGDTVVLFIAGHGVHDATPQANYYFLLSGSEMSDLSGTAVPFDAIEKLLFATPARKKLLLMDTCESGVTDDEDFDQSGTKVRAGLVSRAGRSIRIVPRTSVLSQSFLRQQDRFIYNDLARRSGAIVFSSSKSWEPSFEDEGLQNGLFTHEILRAFAETVADRDGDGWISTEELKNHVSEAVPKLCGNRQHPTFSHENLFLKFGFPRSATR